MVHPVALAQHHHILIYPSTSTHPAHSSQSAKMQTINVASRTAVRPVAAARRPVTVVAQANKKVNIAQAAAAVATTFALFASPVFAGEVSIQDIKAKVCAANPTAKICVKNSFRISDAPEKK